MILNMEDEIKQVEISVQNIKSQAAQPKMISQY